MSGVQLSLCPLVASFSDLTTCTPVRLRTERPDDSKNAGRLLDCSVGRYPDYPSESGLQASQTLCPEGVVALRPRRGMIAGSGLRRGRADIRPVASSAMPTLRKLISVPTLLRQSPTLLRQAGFPGQSSRVSSSTSQASVTNIPDESPLLDTNSLDLQRIVGVKSGRATTLDSDHEPKRSPHHEKASFFHPPSALGHRDARPRVRDASVPMHLIPGPRPCPRNPCEGWAWSPAS